MSVSFFFLLLLLTFFFFFFLIIFFFQKKFNVWSANLALMDAGAGKISPPCGQTRVDAGAGYKSQELMTRRRESEREVGSVVRYLAPMDACTLML